MTQRVCGIYRIGSLVHPDRCYIGSSVDINERWGEHRRLLRKGDHNKPLQKHVDKYGLNDLTFTIIECCLDYFRIIREQYFINNDIHHGYFNVCKIAGTCEGVDIGAKRIRKPRRSLKGIKKPPFTEEHKRHLSEAKRGDKNPIWGKSSGMKGKVSWNKGKKNVYSEEVLAKMKRPKTESQRAGIKKGWIKRRQEGKVGVRNERGQFVPKSKIELS